MRKLKKNLTKEDESKLSRPKKIGGIKKYEKIESRSNKTEAKWEKDRTNRSEMEKSSRSKIKLGHRVHLHVLEIVSDEQRKVPHYRLV